MVLSRLRPFTFLLVAGATLLGCSAGDSRLSASAAGADPSRESGAATDSEAAGARTKLYVANSGGTSLTVIDADRRIVAGEIELGARPHGQIPSHRGDRLYSTTEDTGEVVAIRTLDDSILWRLPIGEGPLNQPSLTADDRLLFVPVLGGGHLAIVDTADAKVAGEVPLESSAPDGGVAPLSGIHNTYLSANGAWVFATGIFSRNIARVEVETHQVTRVYVTPGQPRPVAIRQDLSTMYAQLSDLIGFLAIDLVTGAATRRVTFPDDGARPAGWDNWTHSHGIALTPDNAELWATNSVGGKLYVLSVPDLTELAVIDVGVMPNWLAFTPDGSTVFLTNTTPGEPTGTVSVIDATARRVVDTLPVGAAPKRIHLVEMPAR